MSTGCRYCVIGAGYAGNGVAKAFNDAGLDYDHIERNDAIGGNWYDGVYDSTHIISSRDTTGYGDFPMPDSYPDFPSRDQMLAYLNSYVDQSRLRVVLRPFGNMLGSIAQGDHQSRTVEGGQA